MEDMRHLLLHSLFGVGLLWYCTCSCVGLFTSVFTCTCSCVDLPLGKGSFHYERGKEHFGLFY